MLVKKGTLCFIVDENKQMTQQSISMDKDRELEVGDTFKFNEDYANFYTITFKVVGFVAFFPLIVGVK